MNMYNFLLLCFGFCSFLLGLLVWLKRADVTGKRYFLMACFYSGWALAIAINFNNEVSASLGLLMGRLGNAFAIFIPVTWYHFVITYVGTFQEHRRQLTLIYLASFLIFCFAFSPWFIPKVVPMVGLKYYSQAGPLYYLFTAIFFIVVPMSFFEIHKKIKNVVGSERPALKGLFFTSLIGYLGGSPTFFPLFGIPFPQFSLFLLPIYPFALAYFMIKQKLFDLEEFAQAAHRDKLTAIGVLAASINHEVKNPLFIIKGLAESCLERQKEGIFPNKEKALESSNDAMKRSIEQADRAMDIIKRLSLFAKAGIDSEIKFEQVNISAVLDDILPLVRYELAAHSIMLTRDIPLNLPEVRSDRRYLEEILFNLIVNACQAIKEGGQSGEIKMAAKAVIASRGDGEAISVVRSPRPQDGLAMTNQFVIASEAKQSVVITIQDNGPGIPADKLKDVFRPFYTTKAEGTGLGLYITKQLVEKVRGRIDVQSELDRGTVFTVDLPV